MADASSNGSAGFGAGDGAGRSAETAPNPRIKHPGSGSPPGMYGPHVGSGEVLDIMDELRDQYPDARLHLDVIGPDGVKRSAQTFGVTSFDFDSVSRTYGAGEYRVRVQQQGVPKAVKMFRFIAAATTATPPPTPAPAPAPVYPYPQPSWQPQGGPPPSPYYPYPPQPAANPTQDLMTQMMLENMKSQSATMMMLLGNLTKTTSPDAASASRIGELKDLLAVAKALKGGNSSRRDDDEGDGGGAFITTLGSAIAKGFMALQAQQPAAAVAQPKLLPRGFTPPAAALSVAAAAPGVAPQVSPRTDEISNSVTESGAAGATAAGESAPPPPAPVDAITAQIAQTLRGDANARRIAVLVIADDGTDPDAAVSIADMAVAALDDDQEKAFTSAPAGKWAELFIVAFPQLAEKAALMAAVEREMRETIKDDGEDAGKENDDA